MKKILLFGAATIALATGSSVIILNNTQKSSLEVEAAFFDTKKTVYVNLNNAYWWTGNNDKGLNGFGVHYWNNEGSASVKASTKAPFDGLDYLYVFELPADVTGFIFQAYKDDVAWSNTDYQTEDITFDGANNVISIDYDSNVSKHYKGTWSELPQIRESAKVYFVNGNSWATPHVHYWGGAADTASDWPGNAMSLVNNIKLSAGGNLFSVWEYTVSQGRYVQFNDGVNDNNKTGTLELTENGIYFMTVEGKYADVVRLLLDIRANLGTANIESDGGKEYTNTICGISSEAKGNLISAYTSLIGNADQYVVASAKNSVLNTYDPEDYSKNADVKIEDIMGQLSPSLKEQGNPGQLSSLANNVSGEPATAALVITLGLTAIGAATYLIKKRKEN